MLSTSPSPSSSTTTSSSIGHNISKCNSNPTSSHTIRRRELRTLSSLPELIEDELQVYHYEDQKQQREINNNDEHNRFRDSEKSPSHLSYVEGVTYPITSELQIVKPKDDAPSGIWPVFRIMVSFICFLCCTLLMK